MSTNVICLSDSDGEIVCGDPMNIVNDRRADHNDGPDNTIFDFPPVDFPYGASDSNDAIVQDEVSDCIFDGVAGASVPSLNRKDRERDIKKKNILNDEISTQVKIVATKYPSSRKNKNHCGEKNVFDTESTSRGRAKERATLEKRVKELEKKSRKNMQPGECLKFMQVTMDEELKNHTFCSCIASTLDKYDIAWTSESNLVPNSVTWSRRIENHRINSDGEICNETSIEREKHALIIWEGERIVESIKKRNFISTISNIASLISDRRPTLVVYGIEEYFARNKKMRKRRSDESDRSPTISRYELESNLVEIQLIHGFNSRLLETADELAALVYHFTKAIAEIPLKLEKRRIFHDKIDRYLLNDNKDSVKVDKNGNGLKRLWRQQLCQFSLASLETAEAVCSVYSSPRELMRAFAACDRNEGEKLLKDIPIRRAAGPLSTARKIGPELSKKIYMMFTSKDGEETLGNDQDL